MKKIKRNLAIILAACMVITNVLPVFAANEPPAYAEQTTEVQEAENSTSGANANTASLAATPSDAEYNDTIIPENITEATPSDSEYTNRVLLEEKINDGLDANTYLLKEDAGITTVEIDAPDGYKKDLVTLSEDFVSKNGETLHALIGSTTEQNRNAILDALSQYYDSTSDNPIKLVHKDFIDAEKWNADPEIDFFDEGLQDSFLCWAASLSGILWSSGWAQEIINPKTQIPFASEDEVFTWLTWYPPLDPSFFNDSGEADKGLDWFFDGSYLASGFRSSPWNVAANNEGQFPDLMAECLYEKVSIVNAPQKLKILERLSTDSKMPAFTASVGSLVMGAADMSEHSMTAMGLIIDPDESEASKKYKAIILADPDNDGTPSIDIADSSDDERIADRSNRVNSYIIYPLRLITDSNGKKCWQIVGFSNQISILYDLIYLSAMTEASMKKAIETEGSKDVYKNSDFLFGNAITSNEPPISPISTDSAVSEFKFGEDVYFIFELLEKGVYSEERQTDINFRLALTRDSVPFMEELRTLNILFPFAPMDMKGSLKLNENYDLPPGQYILTAEVNPLIDGEQRYPESYYRNNKPMTLEFTVIGKQDPVPPRRHSEKNTTVQVFTGTWNNPVSDGKWTLDANGIWHYTTNAMFRNTWGYIVNPFAKEGQNKADWFWFDYNGNMLTGWQFINGKWYYLDPIKDSETYGACFIGPGKTPDGYDVDAAGAWIE